MADAAKADGISLRSVSAYRSYETQTGLYNRYVSIDGKANAERYSARPGYSEHQTGLALDINTASISAHFENTVEYAWLQETAPNSALCALSPGQGVHHRLSLRALALPLCGTGHRPDLHGPGPDL